MKHLKVLCWPICANEKWDERSDSPVDFGQEREMDEIKQRHVGNESRMLSGNTKRGSRILQTNTVQEIGGAPAEPHLEHSWM